MTDCAEGARGCVARGNPRTPCMDSQTPPPAPDHSPDVQDVTAIEADLQEGDRRCDLVRLLIDRNNEEVADHHAAPDSNSAADRWPAHPLLAAAQARIVQQEQDVQALYAQLCAGRDRLADGDPVCPLLAAHFVITALSAAFCYFSLVSSASVREPAKRCGRGGPDWLGRTCEWLAAVSRRRAQQTQAAKCFLPHGICGSACASCLLQYKARRVVPQHHLRPDSSILRHHPTAAVGQPRHARRHCKTGACQTSELLGHRQLRSAPPC